MHRNSFFSLSFYNSFLLSSFCGLSAESSILGQAFSENCPKRLLPLFKKLKRVVNYKLCKLSLGPADKLQEDTFFSLGKTRKDELWDELQKDKSSNETRKNEFFSSFHSTTTSFRDLFAESSVLGQVFSISLGYYCSLERIMVVKNNSKQ